MAMGTDVLRQPVVQLLLCSGQRLRGRAGHGGMSMDNTFVPSTTITRKAPLTHSAVTCGKTCQNTATSLKRPEVKAGSHTAATEAGAVSARFGDNPLSMSRHADQPVLFNRPPAPITGRRMLRHNAIEAWQPFLKTGWTICHPLKR